MIRVGIIAQIVGLLAVNIEAGIQASVPVIAGDRPSGVGHCQCAVVDDIAYQRGFSISPKHRVECSIAGRTVHKPGCSNTRCAKSSVQTAVGVVARFCKRIDIGRRTATPRYQYLAVWQERDGLRILGSTQVSRNPSDTQIGEVVDGADVHRLAYSCAVARTIVEDKTDCSIATRWCLRTVGKCDLTQCGLPLCQRCCGASRSQCQHAGGARPRLPDIASSRVRSYAAVESQRIRPTLIPAGNADRGTGERCAVSVGNGHPRINDIPK